MRLSCGVRRPHHFSYESASSAIYGSVEVRCANSGSLFVSPMVLAHLMPWIKRDLLETWPKCSIVVPDLIKRDVEVFLERLFRPTRAQNIPERKSSAAIKNVISCLRIPFDPDDGNGINSSGVDFSSSSAAEDALSQCLSDVDISSIPDRTINENFSDQDARLVCLVCYKIFGAAEYSSYRAHVVNHTMSALSKVRLRQIQPCDRCNETFPSKASLAAHITAKHEVKCASCGGKFSTLAALKSHERTHQTRDLPCDRCGKKFHSRKLLTTHLSKQICGTSRRECPTCGKVFSDAARMRIHARAHTGERPYACGDCKRAFTQMRSLKEHMLIHAEKSFGCELCDRAFAQANHLRYHRAAVHGRGDGQGQLHTCNICSKLYPFAYQLKRHSKCHVRKLARHFMGATDAAAADNMETKEVAC
jgi:DNA-directed RNA polymerase subunit RPC12/RpoP